MRYILLLTLGTVAFTAKPCMAQLPGTASTMPSAPDRREINSTPVNTSYANTRNEAAYLATPRQEVSINSNVNERVNINSVYKNEQPIYHSATRQDNYNTYENINNYTAPLLGNTHNTLPAQNDHINPGGGTVRARYSIASRKYYYYSSSAYTRNKCNDICKGAQWGAGGNVTEHFRFGPEGTMYTYWPCATGIILYNPMYYLYRVRRDIMLLPDNTTSHSNSSQFFSFDGYIVYNTDTIVGIVTITQNAVTLDKPANRPNRNYYSSQLDDKQLKAIVVYKGPKELQLVRLSPADKHLSRVVHNGKLMIYDRSYNFLTTENVDNTVHILHMGTGQQSKVKGKNELAGIVNKTYGIDIQPETITRKELITIINRLD